MREQMTIFDLLNADEMFDGYKVTKTATIIVCGSRTKLHKNDICYLVVRSKDGGVVIEFPNEYGGSYGFTVTTEQFNVLFKKLNRKVYPKSKEIWNGKNWITNPELCVCQN